MSVASPLIDVMIGPSEGPESSSVDKVLLAVRTHLGMDVAFVSEFRETDRVFRNVNTDGPRIISPGDAIPLEQGYCQRVIDGRLPELIPDTQRVPACLELPDTHAVPIGSHLSVPIRLRDGRIYGTFCCFSFSPDDTLCARDVSMMRAFADLLAFQIDREERIARSHRERLERVMRVMEDPAQPAIVYQPIYDLVQQTPSGFEALSRFTVEPRRPPNEWFDEATALGHGENFEERAVRSALRALDTLPQSVYVSINASPRTAASASFAALLRHHDLARVVLEITEHDHVEDYRELIAALAELRMLGLRLAIDDAGAGYASMRHILTLHPDFIKIDMSLTRGIDQDNKRRALASALVAFARETQAVVVAEGIETHGELATLQRIGVTRGQGYLLSTPVSLSEARALNTLDVPEWASPQHATPAAARS